MELWDGHAHSTVTLSIYYVDQLNTYIYIYYNEIDIIIRYIILILYVYGRTINLYDWKISDMNKAEDFSEIFIGEYVYWSTYKFS